jgi:hypothetical protein
MEFIKHLSKEQLEEFNANKSHALSDKQLTDIWNMVILSDDSTLVDLRLIKAEELLNAIYLKAAVIKDKEKKLKNIENIDELNSILREAKDILKINRIQAKIIKKASMNNYALKQEVIKLNKVISSLK